MRCRKCVLRAAGVSALMLLLLIAYGIWIEPYDIETVHLRLKDAYLGTVLGGMTVVQISDLHIGKIGKRELKVLGILHSLHPDIIFLTGDYVKWDGDYAAALDFLARLRARIGVWAVMGDYDYSRSRKSCLFCHERGGARTAGYAVKFLRNSAKPIRLRNGTLWIVGLDTQGERIALSKRELLALSRARPPIILSHSPLVFRLLDKNRDALVLAGDTHGGQVPFPRWPWLLRELGYEKNIYNQGLFAAGRVKMYVNRGIGTSHIPIRILRPPEITVFHFEP